MSSPTSTASPAISRSRRRWRGCRAGSASSRRRPPTRSSSSARSSTSTSPSSRPQPSASAIRSSASCSRSSRSATRGLGEWCHWGATTQDITDTATIMQIRAALDLIEADMEAIAAALADLSRALPRHADGRAAATCSRRCRSPSASSARACSPPSSATASGSKQLRPRVLVGEFGGAAGTLSSLGKDGLKVQEGLMKELEARPARDRLAHGARPHRRGRLLPRPRHRHLRQDLDGREAADADRSRGGLRAVPRGPRLVLDHAAEAQPDLLALHPRRPPRWCASTRPRCSKPRSPTTSARPARGRSSGSRCRKSSCSPPAACGRPATWSRACRSTPSACAPTSTSPTALIVSEAVMMGLGPHLGRQRAHDLVYDICRVAATGRKPLVDLLAAGQGDLQAHVARRAREDVRPRELPRPRRRDGGPRAQDGGGGEARVMAQASSFSRGMAPPRLAVSPHTK